MMAVLMRPIVDDGGVECCVRQVLVLSRCDTCCARESREDGSSELI